MLSAAGRGRAETKRRTRVDNSAPYGVAERSIDQRRLAGECGLVEHRGVARELPVDRYDLARRDEEHVTGDDALDGRCRDGLPFEAVHDGGRTVEERGQLAASTRRCSRLELATGGKHQGDDGAREELADEQRAEQGEHRDDIHSRTAAADALQDREERGHQCRACSDCPDHVGRIGGAEEPARASRNKSRDRYREQERLRS